MMPLIVVNFRKQGHSCSKFQLHKIALPKDVSELGLSIDPYLSFARKIEGKAKSINIHRLLANL